MYIPTRYNTLFIIVIIIPCTRNTSYANGRARSRTAPESGTAPPGRQLYCILYILFAWYTPVPTDLWILFYYPVVRWDKENRNARGRGTHEVPPICHSLSRFHPPPVGGSFHEFSFSCRVRWFARGNTEHVTRCPNWRPVTVCRREQEIVVLHWNAWEINGWPENERSRGHFQELSFSAIVRTLNPSTCAGKIFFACIVCVNRRRNETTTNEGRNPTTSRPQRPRARARFVRKTKRAERGTLKIKRRPRPTPAQYKL